MSDDDERTTNPGKTVITVIGPPPKGEIVPEGACLVVIYGDNLGHRIQLSRAPIVVGRSSKCDLQIDQESVSRNHCRISFDGARYQMTDLGSTNGTYVNDALFERSSLRDGDQIKVGRTILKFITGGNIEAQYHEEIYRLMTVDGLTEVHNKRYFQEALEKEHSRCTRYGRTFSIIVFDIDRFKRINDSFGHLAGDAVLRKLGLIIRGQLRRDDVIARIGGEEFGLITPEIALEGAAELAEKTRQLVELSTFEFEGVVIPVTISLGCAEWNSSIEEPDALVKIADEKLYEAKGLGRNRVCT